MGEIHSDFARFDTIAFDLETTGLNPLDSRILLAQIGFPDKQYVIDVRKVDITPLMPYLSSYKWKKLFFNGKFEGQFMLKYYNTPINNVFDSLIAERIIEPDSKWNNSFEDLALKYLGVVLDKKMQKSFIGKRSDRFTERQLQYAADDVNYLFPLMEIQKNLLEEKKSTHIAELEFELVNVVAAMELTGVPIDKDKWRTILKEYEAEHEASRLLVTSILFDQPVDKFQQQLGLFGEDGQATPVGVTFNINSNPQLIDAFKRVGIDLKTTQEQEISLINHPAAEQLLEYKGLQKLMSSYGEKSILDKIHPFDGRLHPNWKQVGTETGRFSCSDPNMQQIPAKLRACVGGLEDYVILGADFSQMELRILAQESKDPILVDAFQTGKDVHTATASTMFGISFDKVTKEQRFTAKTLNFGITYGMGVQKFEKMMNAEAKKSGTKPINTEQAYALIDRYKKTYKVANRYLESVGLQALREGIVETRFGRRRYFNPPSTALPAKKYQAQVGAIKREGANMPIQGTNADITKMAMVQLHEELREYNYRANIILQVHDEIGLLAHKSQVEAIKPMIENAMLQAGRRILPDIPVVIDIYDAPYWNK